MIPIDDKYLLGVLNSGVFWDMCKRFFAVFKGNTIRIFKQDLERMIIPTPSDIEKEEVENLVEKIISCDEASRRQIEIKLNEVVKRIYGL